VLKAFASLIKSIGVTAMIIAIVENNTKNTTF
jgi:hypothetical protein